ncbi:ABC transporter substrate-binding protein [Catenulispora pinisilvae]|uniref:ABC transporter substrate-binding protein n=1 Tax=Catenulispora pinisilvae TaxID=2705253 RepID=UPI001890EF9C|nr:ABC transporter substrate-binding protein [Catenulispora pinisilvae]
MRRTLRARSLRVAAGLLAAGVALSACSSSSPKGGSSSGGVPGADALTNAKGVVNLTFWHSMQGTNQTAVTAIVNAFNTKYQGKIHVTDSFQGSYDDAIAKYKTAVSSHSTPSIMQIYDVGTRFMVDSKQTVPIADLAAKDGYSLSDLQPNISNYFTVGGKLQSMPFNSSAPLLYINAEAFKKAGLDPANPPKTLADLADDAKKLTVKDSSGKTTQYGFGAADYGWFVEQLAAESGALYCDNGNGRTAAATKLNITSGAALTYTNWWSDLVKGGYALNTGRPTPDAQAAFKAGKVAMNLESTGVLGGYVDAGAKSASPFTVATAPFPKISASDNGGPVVGGASLWIDRVGHSDAEVRASWEFAKFAASAQQQAGWHEATGYFPVSISALQDPTDVAYRKAHPQFQTAIDELQATQPTPATAGCLLGVMPQARADLEQAMLNVATTSTSADSALSDASSKISKLISDYNSAVSG